MCIDVKINRLRKKSVYKCVKTKEGSQRAKGEVFMARELAGEAQGQGARQGATGDEEMSSQPHTLLSHGRKEASRLCDWR